MLCATELQGAHLPCSRVNLNAFFQNIAHIYKTTKKIELCGVTRAFVQIPENGPWSKKFGHPCYIQKLQRINRGAGYCLVMEMATPSIENSISLFHNVVAVHTSKSYFRGRSSFMYKSN